MTQTERALQLLAAVGTEDRRWLVQHLSGAARARLGVSEGSGPAPLAPPAPIVSARERSITHLQCAPVGEISHALLSEPAWLISAVLLAHDWTWSKPLLQMLPPPTRFEVIRLERHGISIAPHAMDFILQNLAERVGTAPAAVVTRSRFDNVLDRLRRLRGA